jgi:hypothetical protein
LSNEAIRTALRARVPGRSGGAAAPSVRRPEPGRRRPPIATGFRDSRTACRSPAKARFRPRSRAHGARRWTPPERGSGAPSYPGAPADRLGHEANLSWLRAWRGNHSGSERSLRRRSRTRPP